MADIEIHINVEGVGEAISWLDRVQRKCEPPEVMEPLADGAEVYVKGAKQRAPKRTGRLAGSMHKEPDGTDAYEIGPSDDLIPIYAAPQEFGANVPPHGKYVPELGGRMMRPAHVPAKRYMERTFREDSEAAYQAFKESLFRSIERA